MRLREAGPEDLEAVVSLERELFGVDAWPDQSVLEELTGPRRHAVVACARDGSVVGYAVTSLSGEVVDLQRIAVAPAHRRRGVARRLLDEVRRSARTEGADQMLLEVGASNAAALAFYACEGFTQIDRRPRYYRDGTDALVLQGSLVERAQGGRA